MDPGPGMRVLFLTLGNRKVPSSRIRVFQYLDHLRREGIEARVLSLGHSDRYERFLAAVRRLKRIPKPLYYVPRLALEAHARILHALDRLRALGEIARHRVVYVQKVVLPFPHRLALRGLARRYLFDFDDAIFTAQLYWRAESARASRRRLRAIEALVRGAWAVVTNDSPFLEEYARGRARRAVVLPAAVEPRFFSEGPERRRDGALALGWVGLAVNFPNLRWLEPALAEVARRHPEVRLKIVWGGGEKPRLDLPMPVEIESWSYEREVELGRSLDIGLLPLLETEFNRGKMARKAIEYAALGTPAVCSPVGLNLRVFRDGENVLLARTHEEWVRAICRLIEDASLRERLGAAARASAQQNYSFDRVAARLVALLREADGE